MMLCLNTGPEAAEPYDHELKPQAKQTFSPFKVFISTILS
jgi:hypothetical protein